MTPRIRLALASLAAAGIAVSGAGVAAAQEPAPNPQPATSSLTDSPLSDLFAPLAETVTETFGTDADGGQYLCGKWKLHEESYPYSELFDVSECQQDDQGVWFVTAKKWPEWMTAFDFGSLA